MKLKLPKLGDVLSFPAPNLMFRADPSCAWTHCLSPVPAPAIPHVSHEHRRLEGETIVLSLPFSGQTQRMSHAEQTANPAR